VSCLFILIEAILTPVWSFFNSRVVEFTSGGLIGVFAKITELIYLLVHILRPQELGFSFVESIITLNLAFFQRMDQIKIFAVFVAFVS